MNKWVAFFVSAWAALTVGAIALCIMERHIGG